MREIANAHVILDLYWVNLVAGTLLPIVVALVTKRVAPSSVKTIILIVLAAIAALLQNIIQLGGEFDVKTTVLNFVLTLFTAIAAHFGVLKPVLVTGSEGAVQKAVPGGIGPSTPADDLPNAA